MLHIFPPDANAKLALAQIYDSIKRFYRSRGL